MSVYIEKSTFYISEMDNNLYKTIHKTTQNTGKKKSFDIKFIRTISHKKWFQFYWFLFYFLLCISLEWSPGLCPLDNSLNWIHLYTWTSWVLPIMQSPCLCVCVQNLSINIGKLTVGRMISTCNYNLLSGCCWLSVFSLLIGLKLPCEFYLTGQHFYLLEKLWCQENP